MISYLDAEKKLLILEIEANFLKAKGNKVLNVPSRNKKNIDNTLLQNLTKAFKWKAEIETQGISMREFSKRFNIDASSVAKIVNMTYLAPDIIEAIIKGRQPITLGIKDFMHQKIPNDWQKQRALLGF